MVGWSGWLCVLRSCCARETRGFRGCTSGTARQNTDQFHVARTTFGLTTFLSRGLPHRVSFLAACLSSRRRYLSLPATCLLFSSFRSLAPSLHRRSSQRRASSFRVLLYSSQVFVSIGFFFFFFVSSVESHSDKCVGGDYYFRCATFSSFVPRNCQRSMNAETGKFIRFPQIHAPFNLRSRHD